MIEDNRRVLEHLAQSDIRDNQRLAASYGEYPLRLVAVVVADAFMDTDIDHLSKTLVKRLAPDTQGRQDRERVRNLLRRAQSKAGGGEALGAIHFWRPGEAKKYPGGGHELAMPSGVDRLGLVLYQFAPGMVMAATVIAAPADTAAAVFGASHASPVRQLRNYGLQIQPVETAKTRDLEQRLRALAGLGLLPESHGLLAERRFPAGTMVVWSAEQFPSQDALAWQPDVSRVLGIEAWHWWEGAGRRLYSGVPVADPDRGERGGYSMIVTQLPSEADQQEFRSPEAAHRYYLEHEVDDVLPLLLLHEGSLVLGEEAGRLREKLAKRANARFRWLRLLTLGALVGRLSDLQYRLERVRQAAGVDGGRRGFQQFPMLVPRPEQPAAAAPKLGRGARVGQWLREASTKPKPGALPFNLRQAAMDGLDRLTKEGLHEVRLTLDRARLLSDIRSTNALLVLTYVLAVLTAILVVRALH